MASLVVFQVGSSLDSLATDQTDELSFLRVSVLVLLKVARVLALLRASFEVALEIL